MSWQIEINKEPNKRFYADISTEDSVCVAMDQKEGSVTTQGALAIIRFHQSSPTLHLRVRHARDASWYWELVNTIGDGTILFRSIPFASHNEAAAVGTRIADAFSTMLVKEPTAV